MSHDSDMLSGTLCLETHSVAESHCLEVLLIDLAAGKILDKQGSNLNNSSTIKIKPPNKGNSPKLEHFP
jgi:hypothetical protein